MPAYIVAEVAVADPEGYREYTRLVPDTLRPFGGEFIVRAGPAELLEGEGAPKRMVVLRFPDVAAARGWWDSETYAEAKAIRRRHSSGRMILVEGVPDGGPDGPAGVPLAGGQG